MILVMSEIGWPLEVAQTNKCGERTMLVNVFMTCKYNVSFCSQFALCEHFLIFVEVVVHTFLWSSMFYTSHLLIINTHV